MASRMRSLIATAASRTLWTRGRKGAALSLFHAPTAEWKDQLRAHRLARRTPISAFVQHQYQEFVRSHPHVDHCGLPRPRVVSPLTRTTSRGSYLKSRLQQRNRPHATARRNSLLRSQQPLESTPLVRVRPGRSKRTRDSFAKRFAQAKRHAAQPLHRIRVRSKKSV